MKYTILSFLAFFILTTACENEAGTTDTTDSTDTTAAQPIVEEPIEENNSSFAQLSSSTYAVKSAEEQANQFVAHVTPKQNDLEKGTRSDTLYSISYIPYKDQEAYLYQSVVTVDENTTNKWCLLIRKNGSTLVDEQIIAEGVYASIAMNEMKVGDKNMSFTATKADGSTEEISLPYDGKSFN